MPDNYKATNEYRAFYVVFQSSSGNRFWSGFTEKGFQHIWCFWGKPLGEPGLMTPQNTLKAEPLGSYIDFDLWFVEPHEAAKAYLQEEKVTDILKFNTKMQTATGFIPRGIITCVSVIKGVMGQRAWWILTPRQLYYYLLRKGATSLKGELEHGSNIFSTPEAERPLCGTVGFAEKAV